jgi:dTDP-4-dehydrorhamnose 3,5-epimerase
MQELLNSTFLSDLVCHEDDRGEFTELYRESWYEDFRTIQWNMVSSKEGILRGVHAHKVHYDFLTVVDGEIFFGLHDLRKESSTYMKSKEVIISSKKKQTLIIPPGVAHGFYFLKPSIHIYGVSSYWNLSDEFGCQFSEPNLKIDWPNKSPNISERDKKQGSYLELLGAFNK